VKRLEQASRHPSTIEPVASCRCDRHQPVTLGFVRLKNTTWSGRLKHSPSANKELWRELGQFLSVGSWKYSVAGTLLSSLSLDCREALAKYCGFEIDLAPPDPYLLFMPMGEDEIKRCLPID
jgi:hypothetical protein